MTIAMTVIGAFITTIMLIYLIFSIGKAIQFYLRTPPEGRTASGFISSYREVGEQRKASEPKPVVPMFIGYHDDRWFDVAAATCWKRTFLQSFFEQDDSIMWRTIDGAFVTRPNTYGVNGAPTRHLNEISDAGAFAWFANSKRFRSQTPPELIERMKETRR